MLERILVVGAGLIGTSIGLALYDVRDVLLHDVDREVLGQACARGAGRAWDGRETASLAVVAVPPARAAGVLLELQRAAIAPALTHVCSVQSRVEDEVQAAGLRMTDFCGGHPLSGRETSGPGAATAGLFAGRPWLICPAAGSSKAALAAVRGLATACHAEPVVTSAREHDELVALISHLPQVAASAVAAQLLGRPDAAQLAGPGLQDTTRVAASDPGLWVDVLAANAGFVAPLVRALAGDLATLATALDQLTDDDEAARGAAVVRDLLERGVAGRTHVSVKRGDSEAAFSRVAVSVSDQPGQLAALFQCAADAQVNVEDVRVEHLPGSATGVIELLVQPAEAERLQRALVAAGVSLVGGG